MTLRIDRDSIAKAMRQAALTAKSGTPKAMSRRIDEALERATVMATEGPPELRAGRYRPEAARAFAAKREETRKA